MLKKGLIFVLMLTCAMSLSAQFHKSTDNRVNHYLTFSLAGGESNMFTSVLEGAPKIEDMPGGDGLFTFSYELRKGGFFIGLGAEADYDFTWQRVDSFMDRFDRQDRENEEIYYEYVYRDYRDRQHNLQLSVPIYFGYNIGRYAYVKAGAKLSLSLLTKHETTTQLATQGTYKRFIHTIKNAPTYGYYYEDTYSYSAPFDASALKISPLLEAGARIPIHSKSKRLGMRIGAYAEYAIPLSWNNKMQMVDYSSVIKNPFTQNQQNLRDNIVFNSILNSSFQKKAFTQLTVGLRWTFLINVTPPDHVCMCDGDL